MSAKLKVKLGHVEVECEGTEEFIKAELPALIKSFSELLEKVPVSLPAPPRVSNGNGGGGNGGTGAIPGFQSTTENIAVKLGVKSGPGLVLAAAARMAFVEGQTTFTRDQLLDEMKTATAYYNEGQRKNMTHSLRSLVKDDTFNEITSGNYALSAKAKTEIEGKIRG